jgi:hypothetical protein
MKTACATILCTLAFLTSACVTGDEITSYVIEADGTIAFSIYRQDLASDQTGEEAKRELAQYIRSLEDRSDSLFTDLAKGHAQEVEVAILRSAFPASVLITGRIPSLHDFAAYLSNEDDDSSFVCTPFSQDRTHGLLFKVIRKYPAARTQSVNDHSPTGSLDEIRLALTEGQFTKAKGFLLAHDKRSALLDWKALDGQLASSVPSITLSLEWQIPDSP